jgi:signal transduction histidine kinase
MSNATLFADLDKELHDLCQPLTTVSGYLELGQMMDDPESMKNAMNNALVGCRRMFENVAHMRQRLVELLGDSEETL